MLLIEENFESRSFGWCNQFKQNSLSRWKQPHRSWGRYQIRSICSGLKKSTWWIFEHNIYERSQHDFNLQHLWRFPSCYPVDDWHGSFGRAFHQNDYWRVNNGTSSFIPQLFLQSSHHQPFWIRCKQFHKIKRVSYQLFESLRWILNWWRNTFSFWILKIASKFIEMKIAILVYFNFIKFIYLTKI